MESSTFTFEDDMMDGIDMRLREFGAGDDEKKNDGAKEYIVDSLVDENAHLKQKLKTIYKNTIGIAIETCCKCHKR